MEKFDLKNHTFRNVYHSKIIDTIATEILQNNENFKKDWDDIVGLDYAKSIIKEKVVLPMLRPDIFISLRRPRQGIILLFGPPGTGKTLIANCIASSLNKIKFFYISSSSFISKCLGDSKEIICAVFEVATCYRSIIFIDDIDLMLSQRLDGTSRCLKSEFLIQLDRIIYSKKPQHHISIIATTNRLQDVDKTVLNRRRLSQLIYVSLPDLKARIQILTNLLQDVSNNLTIDEFREIGKLTAQYSCTNMESLCREASMLPIRSIPDDQIPYIEMENLRPINMQDFMMALQHVHPSISN